VIGVQIVAIIVQLGMLAFQLWLWHDTKQSEKRTEEYYSSGTGEEDGLA